MDEEDFINDLGWNGESSKSEGDLVDSGTGIFPEPVASTSQADNSPENETAQDNDIAKLLELNEKVKPSRKRTGRPPQSTYINAKPTRESQRNKKRTKLMNYSNTRTQNERFKWCQEDLTTLLTALEKYGPDNIKAIRTTLGHKSEADVKNQIRLWQEFAHVNLLQKMVPDSNKANSSLSNSCAKLDEWTQHFEWLVSTCPTKSFALANVFALISEYGTFPLPDKCNGIDFRAMYRYLHCALNGEPYIGMNPETARELNINISLMMTMIKDFNRVTSLQSHLYNMSQECGVRLKNYGRQPCRRQLAKLKPETLMSLTHLNPLNVPPQLLTKPKAIFCYNVEDFTNTDEEIQELDLDEDSCDDDDE